jgi:hypothetical protein
MGESFHAEQKGLHPRFGPSNTIVLANVNIGGQHVCLTSGFVRRSHLVAPAARPGVGHKTGRASKGVRQVRSG